MRVPYNPPRSITALPQLTHWQAYTFTRYLFLHTHTSPSPPVSAGDVFSGCLTPVPAYTRPENKKGAEPSWSAPDGEKAICAKLFIPSLRK